MFLIDRLLLRISQSSFNMILVDKYGMDKERYPFPVTAAELFTLIDTFPLRKDEIKLQAESGQSCTWFPQANFTQPRNNCS